MMQWIPTIKSVRTVIFIAYFKTPKAKMHLSKEQRVFVVTSYLRTGSFKLVQQDFEPDSQLAFHEQD